jgi:hypothetical protein
MLSPLYYCKGKDRGGVHTNSGVNNKAAYLMTDGGTFNGFAIAGLGITKVAKLYYEVQTNYLGSGSDYQDLADALIQACDDLETAIPQVMTSADCLEVEKTIDAVHMHSRQECRTSICHFAVREHLRPIFRQYGNTASGNWTSERSGL